MTRSPLHLAYLTFFILMSTPEVMAQNERGKLEAGGIFSLLFDKPADKSIILPGFGGRITFNPAKHLALEGEIKFYPERNFGRPSPGDLAMSGIGKVNYNGPAMVSVYGVKAGVRRGKVGIFGKARPGFAIFHPVYDCAPHAADVSQCTEIRKKEFAMDFGAVFEGYLPHRLMVRFDAGDSYLRFGSTSMLFSGSGVRWINYPYSADNRHRLYVDMGIGVRF